MDRLDVLIPHFNDPGGLTLSLASVARQQWTGGIRVIVCDDGSSTGNFTAAEKALAECGLQTVLIRQKQNVGRSRTRNALLDAMESPLVAWLDAGDEWYPRKTSIQMEALLDHQRSHGPVFGVIATCNYDWAEAGKHAVPRNQFLDQDQCRAILRGRRLRAYLWTMLCTRETFQQIGYFDEQLPRLQDLDYCLRFVRMGGKFILPQSAESLCVYHKTDVGRSADEIRACYDLILKKNEIAARNYGKIFFRTCRYNAEILSARYARNNNNRRRMYYYLARAALRRPKDAMVYLFRRVFRA